MDIFLKIINEIAPALIVGIIIWVLGEKTINKRMKSDAVRDLMTYRGDYASSDFRRSLNKISITFHNDPEIRLKVRNLYDVINNPTLPSKNTERTIVGLIYRLCQKNGFKGLTEYDIDQAFPESKQSPQEPLM